MPWGSRYVLGYFPDPIPWPGDGIQTINPVRVWILGDVCIYYNYIYAPKESAGISSHCCFGDPRTNPAKKKTGSNKTNPSFLGSVQSLLILRDVGIFCWNANKETHLHRDPTKTCGRRTWNFTNACVCCVPAMVIKWCFRAAPCYSWAAWKLRKKTSWWRVAKEPPRKTFFKKLLGVSQRGILPKR